MLEISVLMAQFPSGRSPNSPTSTPHVGLGYANIGGLLMTMGPALRFAGGEGARRCAAAIMTGVSYATSAEMASELGPFPAYEDNADAMLRVIRNHRRAATRGGR